MHPEYVYHYTSINTLALILRNKKIRFNRLDRVDDLLEAESSDLSDFGRLFFVSCWSSSDEENIPLWFMYTPNMAGVRIKLPVKMFKEFIIEPQSNGFINVEETIKSPLPFKKFLTEEYLVNPMIFYFKNFLREVVYTNNDCELFPVISSAEGSDRNF